MKVPLRTFVLLLVFQFGELSAQIIPWRALIVYSNTIDSAVSLPPNTNLYQAYLASMIDGMNQVYEKSEVNIRAEIAGVVWDKSYLQTCGTCAVTDIAYGSNGFGRWINDSILNRFGADAVIVLNNPSADAYAGGAALPRWLTAGVGHGGYWARYPDNLWLFAHEMGHIYSDSGNADHCRFGHRRTFNAVGHELGGPSPDSLGFILGDDGSYGYIPDTLIETEVHHAYSGFMTSMAYGSGGGDAGTYPCYPRISNTYGGVTRTFVFNHQGVGWGVPGGNYWTPEWTGSYSNPNVTWEEPYTHTSYPVGADTITYINRLRYLGAGANSFKDSTIYHRNFSEVLNSNPNFVSGLRDLPAEITLTSAMNLGGNASDSQWVYAHYSATSLIVIKPGFKIGEGSNAKLSVGEPIGFLAKRNTQASKKKNEPGPGIDLPSNFSAKYNRLTQELDLSIGSYSDQAAIVTFYDIDGKFRNRVTSRNKGPGAMRFRLTDLPNGIYLMEVKRDREVFHQRFIKW
jgi:hypothetical protein